MASTLTYLDGSRIVNKNEDVHSLEDGDLSSLSDFGDDNSLDEYFEDDLIPDDENDMSIISSNADEDGDVVVIPGRSEGNYTDADYSWRTGYTVNWKSYGSHNKSNNNAVHEDLGNGRLRSISDVTIAATKPPTKKKLSVDLTEPDNTPSTNTSSFFRSIGSWFRGSNNSVKSLPEAPAPQNNNEKTSVRTISGTTPQTENHKDHVVGTSFSSFNNQGTLRNSQRKKIHFSLEEKEDDLSECEESSSTESLSPRPTSLSSQKQAEAAGTVSPNFVCDTTYELCTTDSQQYICWQRQFRKTPGIMVSRKPINSSLIGDALIVPGNSFGFLDGEPELQYIKLFGWAIQKRLRQIICQNHDGELLVGEAIVLPMNISEGSLSDSSESRDEIEHTKQCLRTISVELDDDEASEREYCKTVKNLIYVPVMRVPSLIQDTVNAYLAFRAAIRAVKSHNQNCDEAKKIQTVICPQLCGDIGKMPAGRIALQMKTAYDSFSLNKRHDIKMPIDLGSMATNHVELATAKNGNWC